MLISGLLFVYFYFGVFYGAGFPSVNVRSVGIVRSRTKATEFLMYDLEGYKLLKDGN